MSSELFESREDDLRQICENVRKKLTDQLPRCVGGGCGCTVKLLIQAGSQIEAGSPIQAECPVQIGSVGCPSGANLQH